MGEQQIYKIYRGCALLPEGDVAGLLCSLCNSLLRDPVQVTACGDRFCRPCIESYMGQREGPVFTCPVDNESFQQSEVRKDRGCLRELQALEVECTTQPFPCKWKGSIPDLKAHLAECPNKMAKVYIAGTHPRMSPVTIKMQRPSKTTTTQRGATVCDYCNKRVLDQKQLKDHFTSECTEYQLVMCPMYSRLRCTFKAKRQDMVGHTLTHATELADMLVSALERIDVLEKKVEASNFPHQPGEFQESIGGDCLTLLSSEAKKQTTYDEKCASMVVGGASVRASLNSLQQTWEARKQAVLDKSGAVQQRVNFLQQEAFGGNLHMMQQSWATPGITVDIQRKEDLDTTNGVLIWKIPDVRRKHREAVNGRITSLYSPPFYTGANGYKMCISTYLNGDGIGKGTHVSLFFVIMRSEHDNLLSWPFKQSVCLSLVNQATPTASIRQWLLPEAASSSFEKPSSEMNVASGFPQFAPQSVLRNNDFSGGDMIRIKCQVHPPRPAE